MSRNKKNNVYPCKPQFYYIKVGFKEAKIYRRVFVMTSSRKDGADCFYFFICLFFFYFINLFIFFFFCWFMKCMVSVVACLLFLLVSLVGYAL